MPLGKADSVFVGYKVAVIKRRRSEFERAVEQELAKRAVDEISAANYLRDFHGGIIDDAGELVGGKVVLSPDEEVTEMLAGDLALRTACQINEADRLAVGHVEAPVDARTESDGMFGIGCWVLDVLARAFRPARPRIDGFVFALMWCGESPENVLA